MAEIPNHIRDVIAQYLALLQAHGFQIQEAILFGSHASGRAGAGSDIDLALVSPAFEGVRFMDKNKIRRLTLAVSVDLEVLPFKPEHFTPGDPLVKEILETGVRVI